MATPLIINVGTIPDDGTGNILRDAFIKTNNNFSSVFADVDTLTARVNSVINTPQDARIKALEDNQLKIQSTISSIQRDIGTVSLAERGNIQTQLDKIYTQLTYIPTSIISFLINGVKTYDVENGTTVRIIPFNWSFAGPVPNRQSIVNLSTNEEIVVQPGTTSYNLSKVITSIPNNTKTEYSWALNLITASPLQQTITLSTTATLRFLPRVFFGVSSEENIDNNDFRNLKDSVLSDTRSRTTIFDASGGKYIYYAYPQGLDRLEAVLINGLYFTDYSEYSVQYTNPNNMVLQYYVYKINPIQHGNYIKVDWI